MQLYTELWDGEEVNGRGTLHKHRERKTQLTKLCCQRSKTTRVYTKHLQLSLWPTGTAEGPPCRDLQHVMVVLPESNFFLPFLEIFLLHLRQKLCRDPPKNLPSPKLISQGLLKYPNFFADGQVILGDIRKTTAPKKLLTEMCLSRGSPIKIEPI